jgi:hypothetical protein
MKLNINIKNIQSATAIDVLSNGVIPTFSLVILPVRKEVFE